MNTQKTNKQGLSTKVSVFI